LARVNKRAPAIVPNTSAIWVKGYVSQYYKKQAAKAAKAKVKA